MAKQKDKTGRVNKLNATCLSYDLSGSLWHKEPLAARGLLAISGGRWIVDMLAVLGRARV